MPTVEEYMTEPLTSYGMGPIMLTSLYFVQNKLMKHIIKDPEYSELLRLMGTCGRLLNDTQGFEVFSVQSLTSIHSNGLSLPYVQINLTQGSS